MFDTEAFIDGYVTAALWADCLPAEPTVILLPTAAGHPPAWEVVGTDDDVEIADSVQQAAEIVVAMRDRAESGGREELEIRPTAREQLAYDCRRFIEDNARDLDAYCEQLGEWVGIDSRGYCEDPAEARAGHDFWLTRCGHGCGFWDRGLSDLGDRLADSARAYGDPDNDTPMDMGDGTADCIGAPYPPRDTLARETS